MRRIISAYMAVVLIAGLSGCKFAGDVLGYDEKPVIYLYPEKETSVTVKISFDGELTCTYPAYDDGWEATAQPDGTLKIDGKEYSCLFWEGKSDTEYDFSEGFVVPGEETAEFLQEKLEHLGLTPREQNEFIIYWLPRMEENAYNLISFQQETYTDSARLEVVPEPDTVLRVFMAWKPLDQWIDVPEQQLTPTERKGFTLVEWGGSCCS